MQNQNITNFAPNRAFITALAALSLAVPAAHAQNINVTVDGDVVPFSGQQPIQQYGTVLVPLRGVFEKLGAKVAFDGGSRTILAVRGATSVELKIGSRDARVNGQPRTLSLPAQEVRGSTLVPLRFVSEALGAGVRWNGASRTVIINTTGGTDAPIVAEIGGNGSGNNDSGDASVESLTFDADQPLHAGDVLTITLNAASGGLATATIPGIEAAKAIPLKETQTGRYVGSFTIPKGANAKGASVLATLKKGGRTSATIQAAKGISVDTAGPSLANLSPAADATLPPGRPLIYGTLSDAGTGINNSATKLLVNGADVTGAATITEAFFSYKPDKDLPNGANTVTAIVKDGSGNETRKEWKFNISAGAALIQEVTVAPANQTLGPGDVLTVRAKAKAGGNARFRVGTVQNQPMTEESAGVYVGSYTVKKGDSISKAPVTVVLTREGQRATQTSNESVTIAAGAPNPPTIANPASGAAVGNAFTLRGKAAPGATVRYSIKYQGTLIVLPVTGTVTDGEVVANEKGEWSVPDINLGSPTGVTKLTYAAEIIAIGAAGEQSEPVSVSFKK